MRRQPSGWFDSHCHITASAFDDDRAAVLDRASAAGVERLLAIGSGYGVEHSELAAKLAADDPRIFATVGVHPHDAKLWDDRARELVARWLALPKVVAVGECGLDYYYENSPRDAQRRAFADQVALARRLGRPVCIHVRDRGEDAYEDLLEIWASEGNGEVEGVLHCYTHTLAFARRGLDVGLRVSFSGILTFRRAEALREVARKLPLDHLLIETDAPFLAPEGLRGRRNEPAQVARVGEVLAQVRGLPPDEVAAATSRNARALFRIPD